MGAWRRLVPHRLIDWDGTGGLLLLAAAVLALALANSPLGPAYTAILERKLPTTWWLPTPLPVDPLHWINDGLMALFFLAVGLGLKREALAGSLASPRQLALPGLAALGGMAVPAVLFAACNYGDLIALRGWAIPCATDIAFALGCVAVLGRRVPPALKLFLLALAVLDDLGAVAIIAVFYAGALSLPALLAAAAGVALLIGFNRLGVRRVAPYLAVGVAIWFAVLQSGVHTTIAGVLVALTIPLGDPVDGPLRRLEYRLTPLVDYAIVPLFGLANAGVALAGVTPSMLIGPVPLGIALGLVVGKQIGVFGAAWLAIRLGLARRPSGTSWGQLYGAAVLCGIGFTMSLFIADLAFPGDERGATVKLAILAGSLVSGALGTAILALAGRRPGAPA